MPWKCPACGSFIKHNELEPAPRRNTTYRCHICRLELVVDESDDLTVAPITPEAAGPNPRRKGR